MVSLLEKFVIEFETITDYSCVSGVASDRLLSIGCNVLMYVEYFKSI
jgi:hypothetical protein